MSQYSNFRGESKTSLEASLGKIYRLIPDNSKILDVGCSAGYFGAQLAEEKKCVVDGVEANEEDAKKAKKLLANVYSFDIEGRVWPAKLLLNKYDIIFFGDVLEHLKNPKEAIKRFRKLLTSDGSIIVSIPNIAHTSIRMELLQGNFEYEKLGILDETHLKYFTFNSFVRLLDEAGFRVVEYDQSTIGQPRKTTDTILKKIGLIPTKKFYKFISQPDATAFQYKILAKPGKNNNLPKLPKKTLELAKMHTVEVDELQDQVRFLVNELSKVRAELYPITKAPLWEIRNGIRKASRRIKKRRGK